MTVAVPTAGKDDARSGCCRVYRYAVGHRRRLQTGHVPGAQADVVRGPWLHGGRGEGPAGVETDGR